MANEKKLVDPALIINNIVIAYVPNSLEFKPAGGEQKVRAVTSGNGSIQIVVADDMSKRISSCKFKLEPTTFNINVMRDLKANQDGHVLTMSTPDFTATITGAVLTTNYDVKFGVDQEIELEFHGNQAI